jgi:hypothetical protein
MKYVIIIISLIFISCNDNPSYKTSPAKNNFKEDTLKPKLIGLWGGLGEDVPVWEIKSDSIYYFEQSAAYPYKIIDNDLIIDYPQSLTVLKDIYVINDTLFFLDEQGVVTRGYRFKNKK